MSTLTALTIACPRCTGLLVPEWTFDTQEYGDAIELARCLNCGWRDDAVMTQFRIEGPPPEKKKKPGKGAWRKWSKILPLHVSGTIVSSKANP